MRLVRLTTIVGVLALSGCSSAPPGGSAEKPVVVQNAAIRWVNAARDLETRVEASSVVVAPASGTQWSFALHLARFGREVLRPVAGTVPGTGRHDGRVELDRGAGLVEWYVKSDVGLEQGFDLAQKPGGTGPLRLVLATEGLAPFLEGDTVSLADAQGRTVLHYGQLRVIDAAGASVPAKLTLLQNQIALVVDDANAKYPLTIDPLVWGQQMKLRPADPGAIDGFGGSVALGTDRAVIGASGLGQIGCSVCRQGAVYTFGRSGPTWTQESKITAADGGSGDFFGSSVSLSGDTLLVGAWGLGTRTGAAYVFVRSGSTWVQQAKLTASDGVSNDQFGSRVALSGDTAVVSAVAKNSYVGAVYVFVRSGTTWTQQTKLLASDGATNDAFGVGLALQGDTAVVGCAGASNKNTAYVFQRSGTTWAEQAKLTGSDSVTGDNFGQSVALDGNTVLVGATGKNGRGGVYSFTRSGTTWSQESSFAPSDLAAGDYFGVSATVSSNTAVIGAQNKPNGVLAASGAAYVMTRSGTTWTQSAKLVQADPGSNDYFSRVALLNDTILVGAFGKNAAYVFVNRKSNGDACLAGTECTSGICVEGVCCDRACGGACASCLAVNTGGTTGHCLPIPDGTDPRSECGATTCTAGVVEKHVCDGEGGCRSAKTACAPFVCEASLPTCKTACTTDADCDGAYTCKASVCFPRKDQGVACDTNSDCKSGLFCADGVCCDTPCDGQCAACDVGGSMGKCTAVTGKPHGKRTACEGSGGCGGTCDGKTAESCTFPDATTVCAQGCFDAMIATCDGKGACQAAHACSGNFTCQDPTRCRTTCATDYDCISGFRCKEGACVAGRRKCSDDLTQSVDTLEGTSVTCAPYTCDTTSSACRKTCDSSTQCASGFSCDTSSKTCVALPAEDSGGCSVATRGRAGSFGLVPLLGALVAVALRRRRAVVPAVLALAAACSGKGQDPVAQPAHVDEARRSGVDGGFARAGLQLLGKHTALDLVVAADAAGLAVRTGAFSFSATLTKMGRGDHRAVVSPSSPTLEGGRATWTRGTVKEWYAVVRDGVEQGFDLAERPAGEGELVFELDSQGLTPVLAGKTVSLRDPQGLERLKYGELHVKDRDGREVPARIAIEGGHLTLRVDDSSAGYPLYVDPLVWGEQAKFTGSDIAAGDRFGTTVDVSGETAVVGVPFQATYTGAAYVFLRSGKTWTQQAKLVPSDATTNEYFGGAIDVDKDTIAVGAQNQTSSTGAVYVFTRTGTTWTEQAKIVPGDLATGDSFGAALALDGDTLVIGAPSKSSGTTLRNGVTYVYNRTGTTWSQTTKLDPADSVTDDRFGSSVTLSADTAIVGAPSRSYGKGLAFAFTRSGSTWSKQATLTASDGVAGTAPYLAGDLFASKVVLQGDTALISAPNKAIGGTNGAGAVYVFDRSGTTWTQSSRLSLAFLDAPGFGGAIALQGNHALVGQTYGNGGKGRVIPLTRTGSTWAEDPHLTPSDAQPSDSFGGAVAYSGDTAVIGATFRNSIAGVAYSFVLRKADGDACTANLDCLSNLCTDGVCCPSDCTGKCMACAASKTGVTNGICAPVFDGTDPHADCPAPSCTGGLATTNVCDGAGGCRSKSKTCTPFTCDSTAKSCLVKCTADTDCIAADYCDAVGACVPRRPAAAACSANHECGVGMFCVDGLCCDAPCDGQCQACDVSGSLGKCTAVSGRPHGARSACSGDGTCGGTCDGKNTGACTYPDINTSCGAGCNLASVATCDGKGACQAPVKCAKNLQCEDATKCRTTCTADAHCLEGFGCKDGECVSRTRVCSEDRTASLDSIDGSRVECVAYGCDPSTGKCGTTCATTTDCIGGYVCNVGVCQQVSQVVPAEGDEGGCRYGRAPRSSLGLYGLGLALVLFARRRSR